MPHALDKLFSRLGYKFKDLLLVELALTHRSVSATNNERLEFLGDAILGSVVAEELFQRFPQASEGEMTRMRAALVKGPTLAEIGRQLELGDLVRLGSGELKSGGFRRDSILACAVEALIGAVYLDGGHEHADKLIKRLYASHFETISPESASKDPKTQLQEVLQARKLTLPVYHQVKAVGEAHAQTFYIECRVEGLDATFSGQGNSRRKAEQVAAKKALAALKKMKSKE